MVPKITKQNELSIIKKVDEQDEENDVQFTNLLDSLKQNTELDTDFLHKNPKIQVFSREPLLLFGGHADSIAYWRAKLDNAELLVIDDPTLVDFTMLRRALRRFSQDSRINILVKGIDKIGMLLPNIINQKFINH